MQMNTFKLLYILPAPRAPSSFVPLSDQERGVPPCSDQTVKQGNAGQMWTKILLLHCLFLVSNVFRSTGMAVILFPLSERASQNQAPPKLAVHHPPVRAFIGLVRHSAFWFAFLAFLPSKPKWIPQLFFYDFSGQVATISKIFVSFYRRQSSYIYIYIKKDHLSSNNTS